MPVIHVELDESQCNEAEAKQVEDWLRGIKKTEWEIFKENFEAFKRSFMDVCKAFAKKLLGWLSDFWHRIFG